MTIEECRSLAIEEMDKEKFTLAIAYLESAIQSPEFKEYDQKQMLYHSLGVCLLYLENYEEAISSFHKSLQLSTPPVNRADFVTFSDTHHFLSRAYALKAEIVVTPLYLVGGKLQCH